MDEIQIGLGAKLLRRETEGRLEGWVHLLEVPVVAGDAEHIERDGEEPLVLDLGIPERYRLRHPFPRRATDALDTGAA